MKYHNLYLFGVSNGTVILYVKQCEEDREYCVKKMNKGNLREVILTSHSLSEVLREFAEQVATHTGGFTAWEKI